MTEPAPPEPEPVEPAPIEPAPTESVPVEPVPANPARAEPTQPEPLISRGRRRESSRHRTARRVALPGWLAWSLRSGIPLISLVPALVVVVLVQSLSPAAQAVPTGGARFALTGGWLATEPGALSGYAHWGDAPPLGWVQLGLLVRALQGGSAQSVLAAAHGAMLLLTLLQLALAWLLARRLGASGLAAGVTTAAIGVAPIAVASHAAVSTTAIAVVWLLAAAVLAHGRRSTPVMVLAGVAAGAALCTDLIAIPGVLAILWSVAAGRGRRRALAPAIGLLCTLVLAAGAALVLAAATPSRAAAALTAIGAVAPRPAPGAAAAVAWLTADPLSLVVVLVALILVGTRRRALPLVLAAAGVAAAAFWPLGGDPVAPVVALLPIAAVAVAAVVDRAVVALGDPAFVRSAIGSGWLMGLAALLVVSAVGWIAGLGGLQRGAEQPLTRADHWVRESVPRGQTVFVDLAAYPDLSRDSTADVAWYVAGPAETAAPSSAPWRSADYVVTDAALRTGVTGSAAGTLLRSLPVAGFGSGVAGVQIRAVRAPVTTPAPAPPLTRAQQRAAAARRAVGAQLAENPRITLTGTDRAALLAGEVDSRIALVLAQFVTGHRVTVAGFPLVAGSTGELRRQVLISAIDGQRVPADADRTGQLLRFLTGLRGDFATARIDATDSGVLATFSDDPTWEPAS